MKSVFKIVYLLHYHQNYIIEQFIIERFSIEDFIIKIISIHLIVYDDFILDIYERRIQQVPNETRNQDQKGKITFVVLY